MRYSASLSGAGIAAALALVASCAAQRVLVKNHPPDQARIEAIIAEVETLRGLKLKEPLDVEVLDAPAFAAAWRERGDHAERVAPEHATLHRALLAAFGLARPNEDIGKITEELLDEQMVGFYHAGTKRLCVKKQVEDQVPQLRDAARVVLAHEIEHAIQDQYFELGQLLHGTDEQLLAHRALTEGDAMLIMMGAVARTQREPLAEVVDRVSQGLRDRKSDALVSMAGPDLMARAPGVVRWTLLSSYTVGTAFASALWRTGGFALLERAFARPPVSTEQVLHPEKYVAGEQPVPVREPAPPPGWRSLGSDVVGELRARLILQQAIPGPGAAVATSGWGGDAVTVVESPSHQLGLLWSTVWDDEAAARRFEAALERWVKSWPPPLSESARYSVGNEARIERRGRNVAFVRGVPASRGTMTELLALAGTAPQPQPPFGALRVALDASTRESQSAMRGRLNGAHYENVAADLKADLPRGFDASLGELPLAVRLAGQTTRSLGSLSLSFSSVTPEEEDGLFAALEPLLDRILAADAHPVRVSDTTTDGKLGTTRERRWRVGRHGGAAISVTHLCADVPILIFVSVWQDQHDEDALAAWVDSFSRTRACGASP